MPSLRQLLTAGSPLLILDAASTRVQVGWMRDDGESRWQAADEESGVSLFQGVAALGVDVNQVGAFVFCEGPGSVLGIRTAAMAIRTWCVLRPRPVYAYCSLALVAQAGSDQGPGVIADARRDSWHHFDKVSGLRRIPTAELQGELLMPENFRHWSATPPRLKLVPYSIADLVPHTSDSDLFYPAPSPDAYLHEEPSYVQWTPHIHRAPIA